MHAQYTHLRRNYTSPSKLMRKVTKGDRKTKGTKMIPSLIFHRKNAHKRIKHSTETSPNWNWNFCRQKKEKSCAKQKMFILLLFWIAAVACREISESVRKTRWKQNYTNEMQQKVRCEILNCVHRFELLFFFISFCFFFFCTHRILFVSLWFRNRSGQPVMFVRLCARTIIFSPLAWYAL